MRYVEIYVEITWNQGILILIKTQNTMPYKKELSIIHLEEFFFFFGGNTSMKFMNLILDFKSNLFILVIIFTTQILPLNFNKEW